MNNNVSWHANAITPFPLHRQYAVCEVSNIQTQFQAVLSVPIAHCILTLCSLSVKALCALIHSECEGFSKVYELEHT